MTTRRDASTLHRVAATGKPPWPLFCAARPHHWPRPFAPALGGVSSQTGNPRGQGMPAEPRRRRRAPSRQAWRGRWTARRPATPRRRPPPSGGSEPSRHVTAGRPTPAGARSLASCSWRRRSRHGGASEHQFGVETRLTRWVSPPSPPPTLAYVPYHTQSGWWGGGPPVLPRRAARLHWRPGRLAHAVRRARGATPRAARPRGGRRGGGRLRVSARSPPTSAAPFPPVAPPPHAPPHPLVLLQPHPT